METKKLEQVAISTSIFSVFGNLILALIKWFGGYFGNSYALIADAIESTTDVFSSMLVFFGLKYASKPPDANHPYGHGRIEPLITFVVVGFLFCSCVVISYEAILNIQNPHDLPKPWTLWVLGGIIIWKELSYQFVIRKSKQTNSTVLKADAWHHRSDAITSVTAFIGISVALFLGKGYESADDWAALLAALFILFNCFKIFRPALGEIMDEDVHKELSMKISEISLKVKGIHHIEKCNIRKTGLHFYVDIHAWVDGNLTVFEGHELAHELKNKLVNDIPSIKDVLIHIEPAS